MTKIKRPTRSPAKKKAAAKKAVAKKRVRSASVDMEQHFSDLRAKISMYADPSERDDLLGPWGGEGD